MRERKKRSARSTIINQARELWKTRSTYMLDAHAELSVPIAVLSDESRMKVLNFFDRKMSSSYRNGRKAGLVEAGMKRNAASAVITDRA
jgi:hypothetical protein